MASAVLDDVVSQSYRTCIQLLTLYGNIALLTFRANAVMAMRRRKGSVPLFCAIAAAACFSLAFTYASSDFRMKRLAVKKFMAPYEPAKSPDEVVPRKVVDDIRHRLSSWRQQSDATIVSGRYKSGKTVAVEEALRGVCGVWAFTVKVEDWEPAMYQMLGVKDANMFAEVLRRVRAKLQKKKFAKNLTQYPILLLDIPRDTKGGKEEGMKLVSTTAKDMSSDSRYAATAHVLVAASSAASALAFDAGGRRFDIWVGDMTEKEASELLKMHEHESAAAAIIDNCGRRAGDLVDACNMLKRGINLSDIKVDFHKMAEKDVVNFMSLTLDGKQVGQQILNALLQSGGAGIEAVINTTAYEPREIAKLIRDKNAHAIIWHPTEKLYRFASSLHATIAKQKMP
ncbi:unnamed protein product [Effrenium voratum]|nr:unnamed protein product [Effrenium voratum]